MQDMGMLMVAKTDHKNNSIPDYENEGPDSSHGAIFYIDLC